MNETVEIRIRIDDDDDLTAAHETATSTPGVDIQEAQAPTGDGFEEQIAPIAAVLIGAGVLAAAKFIVDWWEKRKGGLVIDQRPGAADMISRDKDVPWGYVVLFAAEGGEVKVETKDAPKDAVERWISEVISGTLKSVTDIATAAAKSIGGDKVKEVPQAPKP